MVSWHFAFNWHLAIHNCCSDHTFERLLYNATTIAVTLTALCFVA